MPTPSKGPRMGGSPAHERLMLANLATALFEHGRITTTETKAKRLRPYAEHLITFGKRGDLHARRQVLKRLRDKSVVHTLFDEIGPRFADRPGGYTRIVKLGPRKGDNAPMAIIELVEGQTVSQQAVGEAERARGTRIAPTAAVTGATAESAAELADESPTAADVDSQAREQAAAGPLEPMGVIQDAPPVGSDDPEIALAAQDAEAVEAGTPDLTAADPHESTVAASHAEDDGPPAGQDPATQDASAVEGPEVGPGTTPEPVLPVWEDGLVASPIRLRLDLAYDGTQFAGWAAQRDQRTVQGELERALATVSRSGLPRLTVAGRTDAGVHARGQVAHVDLAPAAAADPLLLRRLNGLLPPDVRVRELAPVSTDFDARFSALWRRYRYRVADGPQGVDPLRRRDTLAWPRPLDVVAMTEGALALLGEHDFAAYCRRRQGATTRRAVLDLTWRREDVLVLHITADAFCHSMVRSLVGALLAVGEGRRDVGWPASLLRRTQRANDVAVAPPHGLCLEAVGYPPVRELAARQRVTRALRPGPPDDVTQIVGPGR